MALSLRPLTGEEITAALADLPDWRAEPGALRATFEAPTSAAAVRLLTAVAELAEEVDHHPDLDWRYRHVSLRTTTHAAQHRVTARDVDLARRVSALARATDARTVPGTSADATSP